MKKIMLLSVLAFSLQVSGQVSNPKIPALQTDYAKISRNQKTVAWVMLGGGAVLATGGLIIVMNNVFYYDWWEDSPDNGDYVLGSVMFYTGGAAMLGSIPLFIASAKNKGRSMAASAHIKMEPMTDLRHGSFVKSSYPALSFRINLK